MTFILGLVIAAIAGAIGFGIGSERGFNLATFKKVAAPAATVPAKVGKGKSSKGTAKRGRSSKKGKKTGRKA